jgi:hypothetical protein
MVAATLCAVGFTAIAAPSSPDPEPGANALGIQVDLSYQEAPGPLTSQSLPVTPVRTPFAKEPDWGGRRVVRGTLALGSDLRQAIGFAWDYTQGKAYLDLNRNQDLTDDPSGALTCLGSFRRGFQAFPGIHISLATAGAEKPFYIDLSLYAPGTSPSALAGLRSYWQAEARLDGQSWQIGLIENLAQDSSNAPGGYLLLRPWESRTNGLSLMEGSLDAFPLPRHLFFHGQAYRVSVASATPSGKPAYRLELTIEQPKLGRLELTGKNIHRLLLSNPNYTAIWDTPAPLVTAPVGDYSQSEVVLQQGQLQACRDSFAQYGHPSEKINVGSEKTAALNIGGPLTNSVSLRRQGDRLELSYRLLGTDTNAYRLLHPDRTKPPGFTIRRGTQELFSGQFEFG